MLLTSVMSASNRRVLKLTAKPYRQGSDFWIICWSIKPKGIQSNVHGGGGNNTNSSHLNTDPKEAFVLGKEILKWPGKSSENIYWV